jgi:hypothetical protein
MADSQLAFRRQFDDVTAIDFHHLTQFGDDYLRKGPD